TFLVALVTAGLMIFAAKSADAAAKSADAAGRAIRAQTFLAVLEEARQVKFSDCMDTIRNLHTYNNYDDFEGTESHETQQAVRTAIDFLNDIGHLIRHQYVTRNHILLTYTPSIRACEEKLLPWWLQGFRRKSGSPLYYEHFEFLCYNVSALQRGEHIMWPQT